jgi:DNA polymerase V
MKNSCSYKLLKSLNPPTNDTVQLLKVISDTINQLFKPGVAYYKIGIGLLNLSNKKHQQCDLFNPSQGNAALMKQLE